jgi:hypothetical protein
MKVSGWMVIRCDAGTDVGGTRLKWRLSCEVRAGGGGCEHRRLANPGRCSGDGQGVSTPSTTTTFASRSMVWGHSFLA